MSIWGKIRHLFNRQQLSPHFNISEFHCNDGTKYPKIWIRSRLHPNIKTLEAIRIKIDAPLHITSAYRTVLYNKKIGGVKYSYHVKGMAFDMWTLAMKPRQLYELVLKMMSNGDILDGGLGVYGWGIHIDSGPSRRWKGK